MYKYQTKLYKAISIILLLIALFLIPSLIVYNNTNLCNCQVDSSTWTKEVSKFGEIIITKIDKHNTYDTLVECGTYLITIDTIHIDYGPVAFKEIYNQKTINCN